MADDVRQADLDLMGALLDLVNIVFKGFREDCKDRDGVGCDHKDYHKDFALENICNLKSCPALEEKN